MPDSSAATVDPRLIRIVLAADAHTRYPEDMDSWHELCNACEQLKDDEIEALRG